MSVDIRDIAAEVSWASETEIKSHTVFDVVDDGFHAVESQPGPPTVDNTFRKYPTEWTDDKKRNMFWKLRRDHQCDYLAVRLLATCFDLCKRGIKLVYDNITVDNFFVMNGGIDVSDLEVFTISAKAHKNGKLFKTGLYSTPKHQEEISGFPLKIKELLMRGGVVNKQESANMKKLAKYLKTKDDTFVVHWWCCFMLDNGEMVQVDLCGPAYDLNIYRNTIDGNKAPVYTISSTQLCIKLLPEVAAAKYPRKLQMSRLNASGNKIVSLPESFRPFKFSDKMNIEITPADQILEVRKRDIVETKDHTKDIVDRLLLLSIENDINGRIKDTKQNERSRITVKPSGIKNRIDLNGKEFEVHSVYNGRVAVMIDGSAGVRLSPSKLSNCRDQGLTSQFKTLKEMKAKIEKSFQEYEEKKLSPRDLVQICNLMNSIELNGTNGVVIEQGQKFVEDMNLQRYVIEFDQNGKKV